VVSEQNKIKIVSVYLGLSYESTSLANKSNIQQAEIISQHTYLHTDLSHHCIKWSIQKHNKIPAGSLKWQKELNLIPFLCFIMRLSAYHKSLNRF
jgi:hypothetical protein